MRRVLVVAAHPDDETLGCGGTVCRHVAEGDRVSVLILGEGVKSRHQITNVEAGDAGLKALRAESMAAAREMGVEEVVFEDFPDNRFDEVPLLDVVRPVERRIRQYEPEIVYSHHPGDLNIDHQVSFRAVLTATRPVQGCPVREVYAFEVPSSTEWAFQRLEPVFRPNVFVDVAATLETKIDAMGLYTSEVRPSPHPRSPEVLRAIARRWGSMVGLDYAEAFELVRSIRP